VQRLVLAAMVCCLAPLPAWAQDASDSAAYRALTQTPIGAVPLALSRAHTGEAGGPLAVSARYGIISFADSDYVNGVAIGGDAPLGSGRVGFALGAWLPSCDRRDCAGHFMAELSFSERLVGIALGRESSRATLNVGMNVAAAFGTPSGTTLFAMSARLPIALAPSDHGLRLVPYVEPGFGGGLVRANGVSDAGLRAMLGAGVGALGLARGLGVNAGVHRVFMRDGNWLAGIGLSYTHPR
jgi:hypothetical protein